MHELSKSMVRRLADPMFARSYFRGDGIDIGCGMDSLLNYTTMLPLMRSLHKYDRIFDESADAQSMPDIADELFDFVHSAHCLEHMDDPALALWHWWRILKPGGHLVVMVPDEDLYEQGVWPSTFNGDHKATFTIWKPPGGSWSPVSFNVVDLLTKTLRGPDIKSIKLLDAMQFAHIKERVDQTNMPNAESAIEFVVRKI